MVRPLAPEHLPEPVHGFPRAGGVPDRLARLPGPLTDGRLPGAAVSHIPGCLARNTGRRMDHNRATHFHPGRLPARAGHGGYLRVPLLAQRLRGVQGEPG